MTEKTKNAHTTDYLSTKYKTLTSCDKNIGINEPCKSAEETGTSTGHEVSCDSFIEEAETEILTEIRKILTTLGKKSVATLASCVGSGTANSTSISALLVKAGYAGSHCDLAIYEFYEHHRKSFELTDECTLATADLTSVIGGLVEVVTDPAKK